MADIESLLTRWRTAGVLDAEAEARIRAFEREQKKSPELRDREPERKVDVAGMRWQGIVALILGGILLSCGVALFVSAHWDELGPGARYAIVIAMVAVFHLGGGFACEKFAGLSTTLHAVGTVATGAAIALVGQIFNIQEHWPAAVLMWALAAMAGWMLLRDQAQQTLTLLLVPAWLISEMSFSMDRHIGQDVFIGRALFTWTILYVTFFVGSERRVVQGILFAAGDVSTKMAVSGGIRNVPFLISLILFYSAGTAILQAGFQRGGALTTAGLATLLTSALPILAGMIVFHEPLPGGWVGAARIASFAAVIAGAVLLSSRTKAQSGAASYSARR
jgi:uncharacterized membrane protein